MQGYVMRRQPCYSTHIGCAARRRHFEDQDTPRGIQYVSVPDDKEELDPVFCSITCACLAGWMTMRMDRPDCKRCGKKHGPLWVCIE